VQRLQEVLAENEQSVVLQSQEHGALEFSAEMTALKLELRELFQTDVSGNVYVSGSKATALPPHTDTTDTIVIQERGRKFWLFCVPHPDKLEGDSSVLTDADLAEIQEARIGKLKGCSNYEIDDMLNTMSCTNFTMSPGEVLYIPKGIVHQARELDGETSVHLTIALGREGRSFKQLIEQALIAAKVDTKPIVKFFSAQEDMSWASIFQRATKQLENSDAGIALRRTAPMRLLKNSTNLDAWYLITTSKY